MSFYNFLKLLSCHHMKEEPKLKSDITYTHYLWPYQRYRITDFILGFTRNGLQDLWVNSGPRQHVCPWLGDTQGKVTAVHPWHGPLGALGSHPACPLDPLTVASWSSMGNVLGGRGQLQNNMCLRYRSPIVFQRRKNIIIWIIRGKKKSHNLSKGKEFNVFL